MDSTARIRTLAALFFASAGSFPLAANTLPATVITVHDLSAGDPSADLNPTGPVLFAGQVYFVGGTSDDQEIWVSDGTSLGTHPLLEIVPGPQGSYPEDLTVADAWLFFSAWDPDHGQELWRSDGTAAGTERVTDLNPGVFDSSPRNLLFSGSHLYYSAYDDDQGATLWRTEINTWVTEEVRMDVHVIGSILEVGGTVYFRGSLGASNLQDLWASDGTSMGTFPISNLACPSIQEFVAAGDLLFLTCRHDLLVTDGSLVGLEVIKTFNSTDPRFLTTARTVAVDGMTRVFFAASDDIDQGVNEELWVTDGTAAGTVPMPEIAPGTLSSRPSALVADQGEILFRATNGVDGVELWWTHGLQVTGLDLNSCGDSYPNSFLRHGGFVYFSAADCTTGQELWRTDRTTQSTTQVKDLVPGPMGSGVRPLLSTPLGLALSAREADHGIELWGSNGTDAGTVRITEFEGTHSRPRYFVPTADGIRFSASYLTGTEPWEIGAGPEAPHEIADLVPGSMGSSPMSSGGGATLAGGVSVFEARSAAGLVELWRTDGTAMGTFVLSSNGEPGNPISFVAAGDLAYFSATDTLHGRELWRTDGTVAGTFLIADIKPGTPSSNPSSLTLFGDDMYFAVDDGTTGVELWRSDGTALGTELAHDLNPISSSFPTELTVAGNRLVFRAFEADHGTELWSTDGTTAQLMDLVPGDESSSPSSFWPWGDAVALTALNASLEQELWRSDGTLAGTVDLNVNPGSLETLPTALGTTSAGLVFIRETSGLTEFGLTTGSPGTSILLGTIGGLCTEFTPLADRNAATLDGVLYFGAYGTTDCELWRSDGTPTGTEVIDLIPGPQSSYPTQLTRVGQRLFFAADDINLGRELHELVHMDPSSLFFDGFETGDTGAWSTTVP